MRSFRPNRGHALRVVAALAAAGAVIPGSFKQARAAIDSYLVFGDGSVRGDGPNGGIEIQSYTFGDENPTTVGSATGGAGAGKAKFNSFKITRVTDATSPKLFEACANGKHIPKLTLTSGGKSYVFDDVYLTGRQLSSGGDRPTESLTFNFSKLEESTTPLQTNNVQHTDVHIIAPMPAPTKKP